MRGGKRIGAGRKSLPEELKQYEEIAKFTPDAYAFIAWCFAEGTKDYKKWASELVLKKTVPDKKAVEVTGENGEPIKLNIIAGADYLSTVGKLDASSEAGAHYGPAPVQSTDLAQTGTKDNNSDKSDSQVESA